MDNATEAASSKVHGTETNTGLKEENTVMAADSQRQKAKDNIKQDKKKNSRRAKKEDTQDMLDIGSLLAKQKERER